VEQTSDEEDDPKSMEENFIGEEERWFHCFELKRCEQLQDDEYLIPVATKMRSRETISNRTSHHKSLKELKGDLLPLPK